MHRNNLWPVAGLLFLLVPSLHAGGFESPGTGAKALSMGGAFVGVADDWTATYWNPAGLDQLSGTGVGLNINQLFSKTHDGDSMANPTPPFNNQNLERGDAFVNLGGEPSRFNVMDEHMSQPLPATGAFHRFGRWVVAGSVHTPLGFSSEINDATIPGLGATFKSEGYIIMSGVSLATQVAPGLSVGLGIHALTARLEYDAHKYGNYDYHSAFKGNDPAEPEGVIGLLWKMTSQWQVGAVYRTPATLHLKGHAEVADSRFPVGPLHNEQSDFTQDIHVPATYGIGLAYKPVPRWQLSADWQGTDWRSWREKTTFDTPGVILQSHDFDPNWEFTNRFRIGTDYKLSDRWAWRAGVMRDPQARPDDSQSFTSEVDITRYLYSTGVSWQATQSITLDLGYEYGYGDRTINGVEFTRQSHLIMFGSDYRFL